MDARSLLWKVKAKDSESRQYKVVRAPHPSYLQVPTVYSPGGHFIVAANSNIGTVLGGATHLPERGGDVGGVEAVGVANRADKILAAVNNKPSAVRAVYNCEPTITNR
ncbi:hypothetical protein J6590_063621 [Homalodisca vitripennis]|nr:hypothetical protein J6590_063621 [Homalodisca vitripennis]